MLNVDELVEDTINDLKDKIDGLEEISSDFEGNAGYKIDEIKNKSIAVLQKAIKKINEINDEMIDSDEVEKAVRVVEKKSKQLYETSLAKINDLLDKQGMSPIEISEGKDDVIDDEEEIEVEEEQEEIEKKIEPQEILPEEKVEQEIVIENSKPKKKDISSASIDVLRLWLKTGDKNK